MRTATDAPEVRTLLGEAAARLDAAGLPTARPDAEWLLGAVLGIERLALYLSPPGPISPDAAGRFRALVARRASHEPLQYLLGFEEFCGLRFRVGPEVLIPRPETEGLVRWALEVMAPRAEVAVADVGTGSGAVACAVAAGHPGAEVVAVEISPAALAVAGRNAAALGLAGRIRLLRGDALDPVRSLGIAVDMVVANPPYLPSGVIPGLPHEVAGFEPRLALDGGADGMAVSRRIVAEAPAVLVPGGSLLLEIGEEQAGPLASALAAAGFAGIEVRRDLHGVERYLGGRIG